VDDNQEDLISRHRFQVFASMSGYSWVCPCGKSSAPDQLSEDAARRDGERHVVHALGLHRGPSSHREQELGLMVRLMELGRRADPEEMQDFGSRPEVLALLESLERRGCIDIAHPNRGDDRLLAARGVTLSARGEAEVRRALLDGLDILVADEPEPAPKQPLIDSIDDLVAKRQARARLMELLYRETGGSPSRQVDARGLGLSLGWSPAVTADVLRYLTDEGLVTRPSWGSVSINHDGVVEVEQLLAEPTSKTEHFNPINIVNVYGSNAGQIQTGTYSSRQTQSSAGQAAIETFLDALQEALRSTEVDPNTAALVQANVEVVREALVSEGPDAPVVRRLLPTLRDLAVNLTASGMFLGLVEAVNQLPPLD
jgi:hypothetical protein